MKKKRATTVGILGDEVSNERPKDGMLRTATI